MMEMETEKFKLLKEKVCRSYAGAVVKLTREEKQSCCQATYSSIPSLGCVRFLAQEAYLKQGSVVVDFGSGLGHDAFEAAELVGSEGKVIGIDFTPEMVDAARKISDERGYTNVEFKLADMEDIPLPNDFADVIISNCVINLTPNKQQVFEEAYRILKPGGRLVDADEIAEEELPMSLVANEAMWCRCVGGALTERGYLDLIRRAGFVNAKIMIKNTQKVLWEGKHILIHSGIIRATKPLNPKVHELRTCF